MSAQIHSKFPSSRFPTKLPPLSSSHVAIPSSPLAAHCFGNFHTMNLLHSVMWMHLQNVFPDAFEFLISYDIFSFQKYYRQTYTTKHIPRGRLDNGPGKRYMPQAPEPGNILVYMAKGTLPMSLSSASWDGAILRDFPCGPNVLTGSL